MAVLFEETINGNQYKVTSAGSSIRLFTNGLFHSQFNDRSILSGAVWDLLFLPSLLSQTHPSNALILGVGGGAVLRMLRHYFLDCKITGVDIDAVHLDLARKYFGVDESYSLVRANALAWVAQNKKRSFDVIIDDVFAGMSGDPKRSIAATTQWIEKLESRLNDTGVLVFNFDKLSDLRKVLAESRSSLLASCFKSAFILSSKSYENRILALSKQSVTYEAFTDAINNLPEARRFGFQAGHTYLIESLKL